MDTEEEYEGSDLVKDLRRQLKAAQNANKQLEADLTETKSKYRERSVADVLTAKGLNPKVAKFIPAEADDEDAINNWLSENAELFGVIPPAPESAVSEETQAELKRAGTLQERGVSPDKVADLEARMQNADTLDEVNSILGEFQKFRL